VLAIAWYGKAMFYQTGMGAFTLAEGRGVFIDLLWSLLQASKYRPQWLFATLAIHHCAAILTTYFWGLQNKTITMQWENFATRMEKR
jgi:hypothetical protein